MFGMQGSPSPSGTDQPLLYGVTMQAIEMLLHALLSIHLLVNILPISAKLTSAHIHQPVSQHAAHTRQAHQPEPLRGTQSTSHQCALLPIHLGNKSICLQAHLATRVYQALTKAPIQTRASLQATRKVGICQAQLAQDGEAGAVGKHLVRLGVRHSVHGVDGRKHTL